MQTSFIRDNPFQKKKKNRRELNKQRHKHKRTQAVFLNIYTFSCFHNFHFKLFPNIISIYPCNLYINNLHIIFIIFILNCFPKIISIYLCNQYISNQYMNLKWQLCFLIDTITYHKYIIIQVLLYQ